LGLKVDTGFAVDPASRALYGDRDVLPYLRSLGVQAVEAPVGPETAEAEVREHAEACARAGLTLSLHPYTEGTPYNPGAFDAGGAGPCKALHERVLRFASVAAGVLDSRIIVNIHAAAAPQGVDRGLLRDRSVAFFDWARRRCADDGGRVQPVVELQIGPDEGEDMQRIGDNFAELLDVSRRADVPICWDFGHSYMNARRFGGPGRPPPDLMDRVAHVHCHDADASDHQPLEYGRVPWQSNLAMLADAGYCGTVVLEVPPCHFLAARGLRSLVDSVAALRATCTINGPAAVGPARFRTKTTSPDKN
jgi:sugar phosphate isomerase/epimerase